MNIKNGDMPATAQSGFCTIDGDTFVSEDSGGVGLTKREAFAMAAMQGTTACDVNNELTITDIVEQAVAMADALLKELSK